MKTTHQTIRTHGWQSPRLAYVEFSDFDENQHFMTVMRVRRRLVLGRVYKEFDADFQKEFYRAVDYKGKELFYRSNDLQYIKDSFKEYAKELDQVRAKSTDGIQEKPANDRNTNLKVIRGQKKDNDKNTER